MLFLGTVGIVTPPYNKGVSVNCDKFGDYFLGSTGFTRFLRMMRVGTE